MNGSVIVCVTGGSGFVGSHVISQLLEEGYTVRTTVRSLDPAKISSIRAAVARSPSSASRLTFHQADLLSDAGWKDILSGCTYVQHVASPIVMGEPKHEDDLIRPAVEGTLRVLSHAAAAGVRRVVLTSSYLSVGLGHKDWSIVHNESIWSNEAPLGSMGAYAKSKIRAERAAWQFAEQHPEMELTVMCPHLIFGPLLPGLKEARSSLDLISQIQNGKLPMAPKIEIGTVDVRDVAACHILAMNLAETKGQRYILAAGKNGRAEKFTLQDVARMTGTKMRTMPDGLVRFAAYFSADIKYISLELGIRRTISTAKATKAFGLQFRSAEEAVQASAQSLQAARA